MGTLNDKQVASIDLQTEHNRILLIYRHRHADDDWQSERYLVHLTWTPCHLGGQRPWFLRPANGCQRRVAILYGSEIFACRYCHQLTYASPREDFRGCAQLRADALRERQD